MPPIAYRNPCVANRPSTLWQNDAAINAVTMSIIPRTIPGRRNFGHRWLANAAMGEAKYITPVEVVPMAAIPDFSLAKGSWWP